MKPTQLEHQINAIHQKIGTQSSTGVSQYIRNAERLLAEEKYGSAMDQLIVAQQLEPDNQYIRAIMERVASLQARKSSSTPTRPLGVTVGKETNGVPEPTPHDLQVVVKELTEAAQRYQQQDQLETAFNTLMKAYLLDPTSPHVLSAEKTVLPAWQLLQKRTGKLEPLSSRTPALQRDTPTVQFDAVTTQRLHQLREQKEQERHERERMLWREASNPPKILEGEKTAPTQEQPVEPTPGSEEEHGILSRLRKRKFLP